MTTRRASSSTPRTTSTTSSAVVGDRTVKAIVCTHAHDDHVRVAPSLRERDRRADPAAPGRPAAVGADPHRPISGTSTSRTARTIKVGGAALKVLHTPGHAPGAVCLYAARPRVRLHRRHPLPGRARGHRAVVQRRRLIMDSIRARLFALPDETVVHTGHGDDTTIGAERAGLAVRSRSRRAPSRCSVGLSLVLLFSPASTDAGASSPTTRWCTRPCSSCARRDRPVWPGSRCGRARPRPGGVRRGHRGPPGRAADRP